MKNNFKLISLLLLLLLLVSACSVKVNNKPANDGGVYISPDKGENWAQISFIYQANGTIQSFNNVDLTDMVRDSLDSHAYYVATHANGLFYTYDRGVGWHQTLADKGRINAVAVDPKASCIIYAAVANRLYKSIDCNRHWNYQLVEATVESNQQKNNKLTESATDPNNQILSLAVDPYDSNIVYAGTSGKGLYRSDNGGLSWHSLYYFNDRVNKILILPSNSKVIYVVTPTAGIYKSTDQGVSWSSVFSDDLIKAYSGLLSYREVIFDPTENDGLLYACQYGLFRSQDGGLTWKNIKLLTQPNSSTIYSMAINPRDRQEIYYSTASILYRSVDGGVNWITRSLPSSRVAKYIFIDPEDTNRIFVGLKKVQ